MMEEVVLLFFPEDMKGLAAGVLKGLLGEGVFHKVNLEGEIGDRLGVR